MSSDETAATQVRVLLSRWLGPSIIAAIFVVAAAVSWRKWPDLLIDFGTQLYLPWKMSSGSILYKDVMYLTGGPLSQHYHALLFRIFGVSLLTLVASNLLLLIALLTITYRKFLESSDRLTATMICIAIVLLFAFPQYGNVGNFNFITPYCHEVVHGVIVSIFAIVLLSKWIATARLPFAAGAGFCAGLVFLAKPEVFAAMAVCSAAAFLLFWRTKAQPAIALRGFLLYFHQFADWPHSLRSVFFAWLPLVATSVGKDFYYRWCMGLDTPALHVSKMVVHFIGVAIFVGLGALLLNQRLAKYRVVPILFIAALLALSSRFDWLSCGRSLPLLSLTLLVLLCVKYRRLSRDRPLAFPLLWSVFALALLAKLGLFSRVWHYGFVLAMPAFAGAIYLLLWLLPALLEKFGVRRNLFRGAMAAALLVGFGFLSAQSELMYEFKTIPVGSGRDRIIALGPKYNPASAAAKEALQWIDTNVPPDATLAVLPEGVMVNYLSRRTNPTRYFVWNPAEIEVFGQTNMTASFIERAPDYVILIHRDTSEFGVKFFGQDKRFGLDLMRWIRQNYETTLLIGEEPLQSPSFGLKIMKRKP